MKIVVISLSSLNKLVSKVDLSITGAYHIPETNFQIQQIIKVVELR